MQVYISSATEELKAYRTAAIRAIKDVSMEPVYLNDGFDPSQDPTLTLLDQNERYVRGCDVFVGLYGFGTTWQPADDDPKLISQWEYEWARQYKLPCFCYMPGRSAPAELARVPADPRMERFTQSMAREYAVTWMIDPDQVYQQLRGQLAALRDSVFLSYSSKDEEMAVWLRDQFRKDNIAVWRDGDRIEAGAEWEDQLRQALGACRLMITLLSPDSLASNYVAREIRDFQTVNKKVFPVKVRPCEVPDGMASLQIVDATADREAAYFRLKRAVEDALGLRLP